ncbi:MAG: tRNA lysidine(34) synthetase TilS [Oscillospiraceae bacterium]
MIDKVKNYIKTNSLINDGDKLLVCVSGGADSMALINFFVDNRQTFKLEDLKVAHVNHLLRGEDSYKDQDLVGKYCLANNLSFSCVSINIEEISKKTKKSIELTARDERYKFFGTHKGYKIATAHHLNDNIETFIYNAIRGTSLNGLCGIPNNRDNIIRPFLSVSKHEIENYCTENCIPFNVDKTNFTNDYTRNKIRNDIVSLFDQINSNYLNNFNNLFTSLKQDESYLEYMNEENFSRIFNDNKLDIEKFSVLSISLKNRCIKKFLKINLIDIDNKIISSLNDIILNKNGKIQVSKNKYLEIENKMLCITTDQENVKSFSYDLKPSILNLSNGLFCEIYIVNKKDYIKIKKNMFHCVLDYDKIGSTCKLRTRMENDYIHLSQRKVTKTFKKFCNEEKIKKHLRCKIPLIAIGSKIIHVYDYKSDIDYEIDDLTENILLVRYRGIIN